MERDISRVEWKIQMGNEILLTKNSFQLNSYSARIFKGPFKWKFDAKKIKYLNSPQRTFEKHILYLTNTKRSWELDNGKTETKRRPIFFLKWEIQEINGILEQFWTISFLWKFKPISQHSQNKLQEVIRTVQFQTNRFWNKFEIVLLKLSNFVRMKFLNLELKLQL